MIKQDIYDALTASTALTEIVGTNIFYNVVDDMPETVPCVLMVVRVLRTEKEMTGEVIARVYGVNIKCVSASQEEVYSIVEAVEAATLSLGTANETDEEPVYEPEINLFTMNIDFEIID